MISSQKERLRKTFSMRQNNICRIPFHMSDLLLVCSSFICLLGIVLPIQIVKFCTVPSSWYFAIVSIPQSSKQNGVVMRSNVDGCQNVLNVSFVDSGSSIRFKMSNTSQNFWGEKRLSRDYLFLRICIKMS